jgi:mannose-6-phosphate isomerase-like protein (cupin superfamily)
MIRQGYIMTQAAAEVACIEQELETEMIVDLPGVSYPPHRHHSVILFSLTGSAVLKIDDESCEVQAGQIVTIPEGTVHSAEVSNSGWKYVIGWAADEAQRYSSQAK